MHKLLIILLLLSHLESNDNYQLGEGLQLGDSPIYLGGYFSLDYTNEDELNRYRIDDVALMAYANYDKFSFMSEFEYKELYVKTYENGVEDTGHNEKLHIERLYFDFHFNDNYVLRIGKYNSPIGFWNLLPINVLRATSSNPISSEILFPKFTTGLDSSYTSYDDGEVKINLIIQQNESFDADYNNYKVDKHYGLGVSYALKNYTLKLNGGFFHRIDTLTSEDELYYILASIKYESDSYEFLGEVGTQRSKDNSTNNYAGYVQGLYRFSQKHIGVLRLESYKESKSSRDENFAVFGYTYRPLYPVALKAEYQIHSHDQLNKALFSLSVLF